ncbi:hypothetical protein E3Q22_03094 [Wallemia mellicola]|uniref:DNA damage-binding protein 1 n=2 Tax=Wallemia mellicola TaxID=1708541 RepID=A0A4T0SP54_9BASI|nr:hypothetical protein E3Q22_03094 [Wallemia mellicola]TIC53038.1 hypothetical protein E3Q05_02544 [Wallemia mellicola]TIC64012.1 hypothetical protein E3Q01_03029 [Wallemia mellicola]
MIWHQLQALSEVSDCTEVFLIGFWPEEIFAAFVNESNIEFKDHFNVRYLREWQELGTGGGTYHFRDLIAKGSPTAFFVIHSDIACAFPLNDLRSFHERHRGVGTIQAARVNKDVAHKYGCIVSNENALAIHYAEKPDSFVSDLVSTGVYLFDVSLFSEIKAIMDSHYYKQLASEEIGFDEEILRLEQDVIRPLADAQKMYVFETDVPWRPIKSAGSALPANALYLGQYQSKQSKLLYSEPAESESDHAEIIQPVTIDPSATISKGCKIGPFVSIGPNVVIKEGARIAHSIIQRNTVVEAHGCIVYSIIGARCRLAPWARVEGQPFTGDESAPTQSGICILDSNNNKEKVLVAASTSQLIVYSGSMTDGISEIGRVDVNGRVIGIDKIIFQTHESLLLTLDHPQAQLVILSLSYENGVIKHIVECTKMLVETTGEPSYEYCNSIVDKSTQIGVSHLWQGQLHAFKLSYDDRRKTHIIDGRNSQIDHSVVLSMAFLATDKDEKPTLCRLVQSADVDNPLLVFEHLICKEDYVDISQTVLRIETQCPSAQKIVAVEGKKRAVLVIGAFGCEYYEIPKKDLKGVRRKSSTTVTSPQVVDMEHLSVKSPMAAVRGYTAVNDSCTAWLVGDEKGDIYYISISNFLEITLVGNSSVASTLQHLGSGFLFLGSQNEDSKLLVVQTNPVRIVELENYTNLAPVSDMALTHPDGTQGQLVIYDIPNGLYGTFDESVAYQDVRRDMPTLSVVSSGGRHVERKETEIDFVSVSEDLESVLVVGVEGLVLHQKGQRRNLHKPEYAATYAILDDNHIVYTTWTDYSVNIVDSRSNELIYSCKSRDDTPLLSLLVENKVVLAGSADGSLYAFRFDEHLKSVDIQTVAIGSTPVCLTRSNDGLIFALCDVPSIVTLDNTRLRYSSININYINGLTSYKTNDMVNYVFVQNDQLKFSRILSTENRVHIHSIEMGADVPRQVAYKEDRYAVGCVRNAYRSDRTLYESSSCVKLLDNNYEQLAQMEMEKDEIVSVVESLSIANMEVFVVGTYYNNETEGTEEATKGRFIILLVKDDKFIIASSFLVPGCVYAVCGIDQKLAVAVNYQVRVYDIESIRGDTYKMRFIASYGNAFVVVSLTSVGKILVVADFLKSAIYLQLDTERGALTQVGYDTAQRWSSLVVALDDGNEETFTTLGADIRFHLFALDRTSSGITSRTLAQLPDNVSAIERAKTRSGDKLQPLAIYGTSAGAICALASADSSYEGLNGGRVKLISIMSNELRSRAKDDSDNESIASVASTAAPTISREGRKTDKKHFFEHQEYEFGGPAGVVAMMIGFPLLMYYFYICMQANDGWFLYPKSTADVVPLLKYLWEYAKEHAYPHKKAWGIYLGLMTMEFVLAVVMPGFKQKGLPVPSLKYKSLDYNCNALSCFYATLLISAGLHLTHTFRLSEIVDNFGPLMTVAIIVGYGCSLLIYVLTVLFGKPLRMSGNFFYDFFMGASLNPRLLGVDIKMWAEVRVPWVLLFGIAVSGACKQYDQYGTVSPNMAFMVLATGLYINACAKGEECIPQTWDMAWEKFGYMLCFWNFAGVPFTYCYPVLYLLNHRPEEYSWSWVTYTLLFGVLLTSYTIFDLAMAQKSRFKMQQQGIHKFRKTFPQIPGATPKNPTFVQTQHGSKLLTSGPWAYARKPNYCADWIQATSWGFSTGIPFLTSPPIPHWYSVWFFIVLVHRCGRDFERCSQKYGEDWEEYCRRVPYKFIPYVW